MEDKLKSEMFRRQLKKDKVQFSLVISRVLFCLCTVLCINFTYQNFSDDSIDVFQSPSNRDFSGSVRLEPYKDMKDENAFESGIVAFSKRVIRARFPQNIKEVKISMEWLQRNSTLDGESYAYARSLKDNEEYMNQINEGSYKTFYPENATSPQWKQVDGSDIYVVKVKGYVKERDASNNKMSYSEAEIELTILKGDVALRGSDSGFYVHKIEILLIEDNIAKNKVKL